MTRHTGREIRAHTLAHGVNRIYSFVSMHSQLHRTDDRIESAAEQKQFLFSIPIYLLFSIFTLYFCVLCLRTKWFQDSTKDSVKLQFYRKIKETKCVNIVEAEKRKTIKMPEEVKISHRSRKRLREVKRKARPGSC